MNGQSYYKTIDLGDVGEYASFFAVQSLSSDTTWSYIYGLTYSSTIAYGGEGRLGDGIDFDLGSGTIEMPQSVIDEGDEEFWLSEWCDEHEPSVPSEIVDDHSNDSLLLEISDAIRDGSNIIDALENELGYRPDDYFLADLADYARTHGWEFPGEWC